MTGNLKPNKKHRHIYAIIRYEADAGEGVPIDFRITVKKVVVDPDYADREVKRLNELNKDKGSYYFSQLTRFEDVPLEAHELSPVELTATERPRALPLAEVDSA
jgi:hypothetical protein